MGITGHSEKYETQYVRFEKAAKCFSLSYKSDLSFVDALLNRANSYLMDDKLVLAKNDYVDYLEKFPETPQKSKIELLINAITDEIERRKEEERLLEEQNKALWEHINPNITEYDDENKVEWELIDDEININCSNLCLKVNKEDATKLIK